MPMADAFEPAQWSYRAEAAEILRSTRLPIPPYQPSPAGPTMRHIAPKR
jgi:hypothetical protein